MKKEIILEHQKIACDFTVLNEPFDIDKINVTKKFIKKYYNFDFDKRKINVMRRIQSVRVSFDIEGNHEEFYLGVFKLTGLYKLIVRKKTLNLNLTYVKDFNADEICFKIGSDITNVREILSMQACYSFWDGKIQLNGLNFINSVDFFGAQFLSIANFSKSIFNGDVIFRHTQFLEDSYFSFCSFRKNTIFDNVGYKYLHLDSMVIEQYLFWNNLIPINKKKNKRHKKCDAIVDFSESVIVGKFEVYWAKEVFLSIINNHNNNKVVNMFLLLKQSFNTLGLYEAEDKAYYWYRVYNNKLIKNKIVKMFDITLRWLGGYGTKPLWVILNMIFTILFFALIIIGVKCEQIGGDVILENIYLSLKSYTSLTFEKYDYSNIILDILYIIEGFIGTFHALYFTICFSRKAIR